ncbi:MAG: hypothetical protein CME06_08700 [Gemmatimonadetes bacterium]|nr:hypothetical protein [Gemmatimonadota bacterium]
MSRNALPPPVGCQAQLEIELLAEDPPHSLGEVLAEMHLGQRLSVVVPDARLVWTRHWLWSRISHPSEATTRWASSATDLTPMTLATLLIEGDLEDVVVELEIEPTLDEPPLRGSGRLGAPGSARKRCVDQLALLLEGIDPLADAPPLWIEGEALIELEVASGLVPRGELDRLALAMADRSMPAAAVIRAASVVGPARVAGSGALEMALRCALRANSTPVALRILSQLLPHSPCELHGSLATQLLSLWVAASRERWLGHRRSLLLCTLAAPIPLLRELEAQATGLLRGGHAVTSTCLSDLFSILELMLPPLAPRWVP